MTDLTRMGREIEEIPAAVAPLGTAPRDRDSSDPLIHISARIEHPIAATKTFATPIGAGLAIAAHWKGNIEWLRALTGLLRNLTDASKPDWSPLHCASPGHPLTDALARIVSLYGFVEAFSRGLAAIPTILPTSIK